MTMGSEFLMQNKKQIESYNQIRKEVKNLIENNSKCKLKNLSYDGLSTLAEGTPEHVAWFVELMEYHVPIELVELLHNYFGGDCLISTSNTVSHGGISILFVYESIKYVKQNWEDENL